MPALWTSKTFRIGSKTSLIGNKARVWGGPMVRLGIALGIMLWKAHFTTVSISLRGPIVEDLRVHFVQRLSPYLIRYKYCLPRP